MSVPVHTIGTHILVSSLLLSWKLPRKAIGKKLPWILPKSILQCYWRLIEDAYRKVQINLWEKSNCFISGLNLPGKPAGSTKCPRFIFQEIRHQYSKTMKCHHSIKLLQPTSPNPSCKVLQTPWIFWMLCYLPGSLNSSKNIIFLGMRVRR